MKETTTIEKVMTFNEQKKLIENLISNSLPPTTEDELFFSRQLWVVLPDDSESVSENLAVGFAMVRSGFYYLQKVVSLMEEQDIKDTPFEANVRFFRDCFHHNVDKGIVAGDIDDSNDMKESLKNGCNVDPELAVCQQVARFCKPIFEINADKAILQDDVVSAAAKAIAEILERYDYGMAGYKNIEVIKDILKDGD